MNYNMQFFKKILLSITCCFAGAFSIAQQIKNENIGDSYRAIHWTVRDDLSAYSRHAMIKDSKGFMWIGSSSDQGELCRFDGATFKKYIPDPQKSGTINSEFIQSFEEDSLHNIWIGTGKGISRYDSKADTFTNFLPLIDTGSSSKTIVPFWATKDEMYCMEPGGAITAINIYTLKRRLLVKLSIKDDDYAWLTWNTNKSFFEKSSNSIWKLSWDAEGYGRLQQIFLDGRTQYYTWPCYNKTKHRHTVGSQPRHFAEDMRYDPKRNSVWINSGEGLLEFSLNDKKFRRIEELDKMTGSKNYDRGVGVDIDRQGRIWFSTWSEGIFIYDPETEQVRKPLSDTSSQKLAGEANLRLYCDRDGIVWTSNWSSNGVYELLPYNPPVKRYAPDPKLPGSISNKNIENIIPGPQGKLWIGTADGLNIFDPETEKFEILREKDLPGIKGPMIAPVYIDTVRQKAWLAAMIQKGAERVVSIYEMNLETRECRPIIFRDGSRQFDKTFFYGEQARPYKNGLLICDLEQGLFEVKENSLFADLVFPFKGIGWRMILKEDRFLFLRGLGTIADQSASFENKNGKWIKIPHLLDTLKWNNIVYDKKDQSQWISFPYELVHYDKDFHKIRSYTGNDGYAGPAFNMLFDNAGYIWFDGSLNQMCRLDTASGIVTTLTEADGYEKQTYGEGSSSGKDAGGNFYFGAWGEPSNGGLERIYPERVSHTTSAVYLNTLYINQKPFSLYTQVNELGELSLKYNQNTIRIEAGIIDYYSGKGKIRYKLGQNGKEGDWQYPPDRIIRYESLSPGSYRLVVQSSNINNEFNSPEKTLMININPAFWNTLWFRIVALLCIIGIIYGVLRWRLQQRFRLKLERSENEKQLADFGQKNAELQQQKTEMEMQALRAQMNPHFIFNSLNSINRFILQNNREQASEFLTKFSKLVRMILQNSQASSITLDSELESLGLYLNLEALRFNYHFDYKISVPKDMDISALHVPPLILQPYVENAIWHGLMHKEEKGQLDINVSEEDDHVYFKITDNGIGRKRASELSNKSATKHKSMGLKITAHRIAMMQNSNGLESPVKINDLVNPDGTAAGTEVIIKMPVIYD